MDTSVSFLKIKVHKGITSYIMIKIVFSFLKKLSMPDPVKKEVSFIIPGHSNPVLRILIRLIFSNHPTYSLLILSALTPREYKIKILSQQIFYHVSDAVKNSLVGISCSTVNATQAYAIADRYRRAGATVVMGGSHVSALPEEALQHCDSIVIDEGESVWPTLMKDFENHSLKKIYYGQPLSDFFSRAFPYFLQLPPKTLLESGLMTSRGCKYHCDFCGRPSDKLRMVDLEQVLALVRRIKEQYKKPYITFWDNNIFSNPAYAKDLFRALIPLKIRWIANATIDIAWDDEALDLARASGCEQLFIGFETIHPQQLPKTSVHGATSPGDYLKAIRRIQKRKIRIIGSFIIGFDDYTHRDYLKLVFFLLRARIFIVSSTVLTPFPHTVLFNRLNQENRIKTLDWRRYHSFGLVYRPKHLSEAEVLFWFWTIRLLSGIFSIATQGILVVPILVLIFLQFI